MTRKKIPYSKKAKTLDQQIKELQERGLYIDDERKAKECLSVIGYYRLGFYIHPFEETYPLLSDGRKHQLRPGTLMEEVIAFYYFDFDLRNILYKYISRIEIAVRAALLYELSNKYVDDPFWYVNPTVVDKKFIEDFTSSAYNSIRKNDVIKRHHKKYKGTYAPAWKTMEYMTMGNLEKLYANLILDKDKKLVSNRFGEPATATFKSYLSALRELRNACAHGKALFDLRLYSGIRSGKAGKFVNKDRHSFREALLVVDYLIRAISVNRARDMRIEICEAAIQLYQKAPVLRPLIEKLIDLDDL